MKMSPALERWMREYEDIHRKQFEAIGNGLCDWCDTLVPLKSMVKIHAKRRCVDRSPCDGRRVSREKR